MSFNAWYAATERVTLTGELEWVRGHNRVNNSTIFFPASNTTVTDLGLYSEVLNESTRVRVGVDWMLRRQVVAYGRYELYNFSDVFPGYQTGLALEWLASPQLSPTRGSLQGRAKESLGTTPE